LLACFQDGRRDVLTLNTHVQGASNPNCCLPRLTKFARISSSYRAEMSFLFQLFLNKLQLMFTFYKEEVKELTEEAKV
jgi:hypothetical protein